MSTFRLILVLIVLATVAGIGHAKEKARKSILGRAPEPQLKVAILLDPVNSFGNEWEGKAYQFLVRIVDKMFQQRMQEQIVIAQVGRDQSLLFDGTPLQLRRAFASEKEFKKWIDTRWQAAPEKRVHDSIIRTVNYLTRQPGVASGRTQTALLILSDLDDQGSQASEEQLIEALAKYRRTGGELGFYFVSERHFDRWPDLMRRAGWEGDYQLTPQIGIPEAPDFEE